MGRLLEEAQIKPHPSRYWLTPPMMMNLMRKLKTSAYLYITAIERAVVGERTVCIDEMTGIQAIERKEKTCHYDQVKLNDENLSISVMEHRH